MALNVGIFIFDQVEVLDFAGPFEVFTTASRMHLRAAPTEPAPYRPFLIAETDKPIAARGNFRVLPEKNIGDIPGIDILLIPGGPVDEQLNNSKVISWIKRTSESAEIVASVCTGSFFLAKAGLLKGLKATTHWEDIPDFAAAFPEVTVLRDQRWVEQGHILTSAGISAGIDMSLHIVRQTMGEALALKTARQMEYRWVDAN